MERTGIVLSICDLSGIMVQPWAQAGWECVIVDSAHENENRDGNIRRVSQDVFDFNDHMFEDVYIAFAFPPCTHLAAAGRAWWDGKGDDKLAEALQLVNRCWDIISVAGSYMLENPVGRLSTNWREPDHKFDPCDYGGYLGECVDNYTKKTCLWVGGDFYMPPKRPVKNTLGSMMHQIPEYKDRAFMRSLTPRGFAQAVYEWNK